MHRFSHEIIIKENWILLFLRKSFSLKGQVRCLETQGVHI